MFITLLKPKQVEIHWRSLHGAAWQQFVGEVFRRQGYWVKEIPGDRDEGLDLIATYDNERLGIQCKGGVDSVGVAAVQQALAGQAIHKCHRAVVVTNGEFSEQAQQLAKSTGCRLVDASEFAQLSGDCHFMVKRKSASPFSKLGTSVWNFLVRSFGMTLAIATLGLGVMAIAALMTFVVAQLDLASPSHQELDIPKLPLATSETVQPASPPVATTEGEPSQSRSPPTSSLSAAAEESEPRDEAAESTRIEQPRRWESADGEFSVLAVYTGYEDGEVTLRRVDTNDLITVRLDQLSQKDKKAVAARIRRDQFGKRTKDSE